MKIETKFNMHQVVYVLWCDGETWKVSPPFLITGIHISLEEGDSCDDRELSSKYLLGRKGRIDEESILYSSKDDAQSECDKMNGNYLIGGGE